MAVNPPVAMNPPHEPPALHSRWEYVGYDWELEQDRVLYVFRVIALSECGWALCFREDNGMVEPRYCGGQNDWRSSPCFRELP